MSVETAPETAVSGVKGGSPRFKSAREELPELSRIYIEERNAKMAAQRRGAEIDLALREGTLIPRRRVKLQAGFLLTALRQSVMSLAYSMPIRLAGKSEHEISQILGAEVRSILNDVVSWPERMVDPTWVEAIDSDLMPAGSNGEGPKNLGKLEVTERREAAARKVITRQRERRKKKA